MRNYLCIALRWLDDRYHGQNQRGDPEWPPSPLRLFQAMLASACRKPTETEPCLASLRWFQHLSAPIIVAPRTLVGQAFTRYVPNNDSDKRFKRQDRLAAKLVRPTLLIDATPIRYAWELFEAPTGENRGHLDRLCAIAQGVVALGWGVDMTVGSGSLLSETDLRQLPGEFWFPQGTSGEESHRVPCSATLDALIARHKQFLNRLGQHDSDGDKHIVWNSCFSDVPPLDGSAYQRVAYRRPEDLLPRSFAAFQILSTDGTGFRAFDPARSGLTLAGMTRCAAKIAAERAGGTWAKEKINAFVLGHGNGGDEAKPDEHFPVGPQRFAYIPLPSIEPRSARESRVVGSIRRVMLTCFAGGCDDELGWARRMLSGEELIDERKKAAVALLSVIPGNEKIVRCYTQAATTWATVTPVVLPGYDDPEHLRRRMNNGNLTSEQHRRIVERLADRIDALLRKAIIHAGLPQELAENAELEWRKVGFWPGTDLADRYGVPDHLKRFPRFHVKVRWRNGNKEAIEVPGPICFGGGRFYGIGLFAPI